MERKTETILIIGVIALVLIGILAYIGFNQGYVVKEDVKPTVKIGASLPLTGGAGFLGQGMRDAILLAKENQKDTKYNYEIIFEDDKLDSKEASTIAQKFVNIDQVDVIISATSGPGNVIAPIAEQGKVIHMSTASDGNIAKKEYNFLDWTTPEEEARAFVRELKRRNIKRLAIIEINQQGILAISNAVKAELKNSGIEVVANEKINFGDKDFKTVLLKCKQKNPEIYLLEAMSPEIEELTKQARENGITALTSIESFEMSEQPELFEGLWYVNAADTSSNFADMFEARYGRNPPLASANGYDEFNLIVAAYENAGKNLGANEKPTTKQVSDELLKIKNFKGALGTLNVLDNRKVDSKAVIREIKNGKPITIGGNQ